MAQLIILPSAFIHPGVATYDRLPHQRQQVAPFSCFKTPAYRTSPLPSPIRCFTTLDKLPLEIRTMIWRLADAQYNNRVVDMDWTPTASNDVPPLLHTGQEVRKEFLKNYKLLRHQNHKHLFYSPQMDTLAFGDIDRVSHSLALWKNQRPTRRGHVDTTKYNVMEYDEIVDSVQSIIIKDRSSMGWFDLDKLKVFKNLRKVVLRCPWTIHAESRVAEWKTHWDLIWTNFNREAPELVFELGECPCHVCGGRAHVVYVSR